MGPRAICVWKADSDDAEKTFVEDSAGDISTNEFFPVNEQNAQGLPA